MKTYPINADHATVAHTDSILPYDLAAHAWSLVAADYQGDIDVWVTNGMTHIVVGADTEDGRFYTCPTFLRVPHKARVVEIVWPERPRAPEFYENF